MYSIFHFWKHLAENKIFFSDIKNIDEFPFDEDMLSCENKGVFPDIAIKLNKNGDQFTGGELIEIKDSKSYNISSFNSTIPTGKKNIRVVASSEHGAIFKQMRDAGDNVFSLEVRDVYYFVRGRKKEHQKICVIHGSFFETVKADELIREAFSQVLDEGLADTDITNEVKDKLKSIFSRQESFSRVRDVEKASVKLRFRIMTEVKNEGNILKDSQYPEIKDDTLNLVVPYHSDEEKRQVFSNAESVMGKEQMKNVNVFPIKHPLNGWFLVFQVDLK
jgi:hypothetical protein